MSHELSFSDCCEKKSQKRSTSQRKPSLKRMRKYRIRSWNKLFEKYESATADSSTDDEGVNEKEKTHSNSYHGAIYTNDTKRSKNANVEKCSPIRCSPRLMKEEKDLSTSNRNGNGSHYSARKYPKSFSVEESSSKRHFTRQAKMLGHFSASEIISKQENTSSNTINLPPECANETMKYGNTHETDENFKNSAISSNRNKRQLERYHDLNDELKQVDNQPHVLNNSNELSMKNGNETPTETANSAVACEDDSESERVANYYLTERVLCTSSCNTVQQNTDTYRSNELEKRDRSKSPVKALENADYDFQCKKSNTVEYKANKVLDNEHIIDIHSQSHESLNESVKTSSGCFEIQGMVDSQSLHEVNDDVGSTNRVSKTTKLQHNKHLQNQEKKIEDADAKLKMKKTPFVINHCWIHSNNQINFINKPTRENCVFCRAERYDKRMAKEIRSVYRL